MRCGKRFSHIDFSSVGAVASQADNFDIGVKSHPRPSDSRGWVKNYASIGMTNFAIALHAEKLAAHVDRSART